MTRIWLAIALLYPASAVADCRPEGRKVFAEGLDALARAELSVAAAHFTGLVRSQPSCAEARNNLAVVQVEQGHLSEADDGRSRDEGSPLATVRYGLENHRRDSPEVAPRRRAGR